MLQPFDSLPSDARIWIYQSDRFFTDNEKLAITKKLSEFVENWTAHQRELAAGFTILHDLFIVIGIDEKMAMASGCSIDKSVHIIQQIEQEMGLSLLNRMMIAYKDNGSLKVVKRKEFEQFLENGKINENTIVYNNLINEKRFLDDAWETELKNSWHFQVFVPVKK